MSTLTRRPSGNGNKIPDYKDYMSFVSAYRNGKKETHYSNQDQVVVTSNINPSVLDQQSDSVVPRTKTTCESFSNFLEKTKSKKFVSVRPPLIRKNDEIDNKKQQIQTLSSSTKKTATVKTEIYLEINNDDNIDDEEHRKTSDVCELRSRFEKSPDKSEENGVKYVSISKSVEAKKKMFETNDKVTTSNHRKITNGTTVKQIKISNNHNHIKQSENTIDDKTTDLKSNSIINSSFLHKTKIISEKLEEISDNCQKIPEDIVDHNNREHRNVKTEENSVQKENKSTENNVKENKDDFKNKEEEITDIFIPVPPAMPTSGVIKISEIKSEKIVELNNGVKKSFIPPPPPAMPSSFNHYVTPIKKVEIKTSQTLPRNSNNISNNNKSMENVDPLIKKMAYGAMLDMYGAYHNKANTYVATLPKNRVKKDGNLQKIIDNIAAQGGLEKLSGRTNPKEDWE